MSRAYRLSDVQQSLRDVRRVLELQAGRQFVKESTSPPSRPGVPCTGLLISEGAPANCSAIRMQAELTLRHAKAQTKTSLYRHCGTKWRRKDDICTSIPPRRCRHGSLR